MTIFPKFRPNFYYDNHFFKLVNKVSIKFTHLEDGFPLAILINSFTPILVETREKFLVYELTHHHENN